jgi:parvulin-like peptidyl-prolyl isomerase
LIQKAKELNYKVDTDVNKELAEIQKNAAAGKPELADPEKFQQFVREQTGLAYEDYKGERTNFHMSQRVIREEVGRRVTFKKEELKAYYDAHRDEFKRNERIFLREILISTEGKNTPEALAAAEKKAKDLVAQARRGVRFPELAQNNSDAASSRQGGALEPYEKGVLSEQLEDLVWTQERGYVTEPIKISNGFMILKVDDHQQAGIPDYEIVEGEINERLFQSRMDPSLRAYLMKLRETAFLEIKKGYVDSGAAPGKNTAWTDPAELKPETVTKEEVIGNGRRKRLLWTIPLPGTNSTGGTSSSR